MYLSESTSTSSKQSDNDGALKYQFVVFVLWAIVYGTTDKSTFEALGGGEFYTLAQLIVWGTTAVYGSIIITAICGVVGTAYDYTCCIAISGIGGTIAIVGLMGTVIANLVIMFIIMDHDIQHYFIGYEAFWRSRAFNYSVLGLNHTVTHDIVYNGPLVPYPSHIWPYDMADILVRISCGCTMIVIFIIVFVGFTATCGWLSNKCSCKETTESAV